MKNIRLPTKAVAESNCFKVFVVREADNVLSGKLYINSIEQMKILPYHTISEWGQKKEAMIKQCKKSI